jgi:hypothetical protein
MNKNTHKYIVMVIIVGILIFTSSNYVKGAVSIYYDETDFLNAAGTVTMESFETIPIIHTMPIDHTSLASPIPGYNPANPNFDLDGHFTLSGWQLSMIGETSNEFMIINDGSPTDEIDGINYLHFEEYFGNRPWEGTGEVVYPYLTFDNFNNTNSSVYAFGLYFLRGGLYMVDFGDQRVTPEFTGPGPNFLGFVSETPASEIIFYVGGGSIDEVYYSTATSSTPVPSAVWLLGSGLLGLGVFGWRKKRG